MIQMIAGAGIGGLIVGGILSALLMGQYKDAVWQSSVDQLKIEAANVLIAETDAVIKQERAALVRVQELEAQHVQEEKTIHDVERRNRALAAQLGGLRDPGRRASSQGSMSTTPASPEGAGHTTAPGNLSGEATEVLLAASTEVDRLALWARACYEWKETVVSMHKQKDDETMAK